jgi:hypothetical protein
MRVRATIPSIAFVAALVLACDKRPAADAAAAVVEAAAPAGDAAAPTAARDASRSEAHAVGADAAGAGAAGSRAPCARDSDCVPDSCCHARGCTTAANAPACAGIVCTLDIEPETLDMGKCVCKRGACIAEIAKAPEGIVPR